MSVFIVWCAISAVLICNYVLYVLMKYNRVQQLGKSNFKNRTIALPEDVWGQLAYRGLLFLLGSIFFAAIAWIVIAFVRFNNVPFKDADLALVLASWLGGLYSAIVVRAGAKISYWTAWSLQFVQ